MLAQCGDMARSRTSSGDKQRWMRDRHAGATPIDTQVPTFTERHYSVSEIAALWKLSQDAVRKIFHDEPGVLVLGGQETTNKRRYTTLRIPESVLQRVHRRLANV